MTAYVRNPSVQLRLVLLVVLSIFGTMILTASSAHASALKLTANKRPAFTSQAPCTTQAVTITTPAGASSSSLVVGSIDAARCAGLPIAVTLYDPKASATWTSAWKAYGTGAVTAATTSLTLTATATGAATAPFTPKIGWVAYVTVGGWRIPATWLPGTPVAQRLMTMKESQYGKCLTVNGAMASGTSVVISTCANGNGAAATAQKWTLMSDGTLRAGGFCLAVPGNVAADVVRLQILPCTLGGAGMQWTQDSTRSDPGTFQWVSGLWWTPDPATNGCLDNEGGASANGTNQILYHCINNHGNQEWILTTTT